jgi:hypothetical protein
MQHQLFLNRAQPVEPAPVDEEHASPRGHHLREPLDRQRFVRQLEGRIETHDRVKRFGQIVDVHDLVQLEAQIGVMESLGMGELGP